MQLDRGENMTEAGSERSDSCRIGADRGGHSIRHKEGPTDARIVCAVACLEGFLLRAQLSKDAPSFLG